MAPIPLGKCSNGAEPQELESCAATMIRESAESAKNSFIAVTFC
ncbi:hypothetical protein QO012_002255 [Methylobacterium aerolatum]|uniref:Uncharacterized protein n=1 Tax=Methylobacterium aerolatum TaxID=418708 RepID=A0ABU0HZH6_9HYPH|nr:hypothetical protein [Methylobacterium aerolatum]GJD34853.1 hypothetical protein FMGBMHLM_1759 [Methylobacterium aerolatum]